MSSLTAIALLSIGCASPNNTRLDSSLQNATMIGAFVDDYGSQYTISESAWVQDSSYTFRVVQHYKEAQYVIVQNDSLNPSEAGLFSRIDYLRLPMDPYTWAFCLTIFDASSAEAAKRAQAADRSNPRTGCAGFPFTRMAPS